MRAALTLARDDIDDTRHGAIAVELRAGSGDEIDACYLVGGNQTRIELAVER